MINATEKMSPQLKQSPKYSTQSEVTDHRLPTLAFVFTETSALVDSVAQVASRRAGHRDSEQPTDFSTLPEILRAGLRKDQPHPGTAVVKTGGARMRRSRRRRLLHQLTVIRGACLLGAVNFRSHTTASARQSKRRHRSGAGDSNTVTISMCEVLRTA